QPRSVPAEGDDAAPGTAPSLDANIDAHHRCGWGRRERRALGLAAARGEDREEQSAVHRASYSTPLLRLLPGGGLDLLALRVVEHAPRLRPGEQPRLADRGLLRADLIDVAGDLGIRGLRVRERTLELGRQRIELLARGRDGAVRVRAPLADRCALRVLERERLDLCARVRGLRVIGVYR